MNTTMKGISWKHLKHIVMNEKNDVTSIEIPLDDNEQLLLMRYIEAEKQEKDFITRKLAKNFTLEVLLYTYYAGHGCSKV